MPQEKQEYQTHRRIKSHSPPKSPGFFRKASGEKSKKDNSNEINQAQTKGEAIPSNLDEKNQLLGAGRENENKSDSKEGNQGPSLKKQLLSEIEKKNKNQENNSSLEKRLTISLLATGGEKTAYVASGISTVGEIEFVVTEPIRVDEENHQGEPKSAYENFLSLFYDSPFMTQRLGVDLKKNDREYWPKQAGSLEMIPISYADIPSFFFALCCSIEELREKGFAHLDLKPSNITVGNDGAPKWIDFNQVVDVRKGMRNYVLTPAFAPPELTQAPVEHVKNGKISKELSARLSCLDVDLWEIGAILYFLYTRSVPLRNEKGEFIGFDTLEARNEFIALDENAKKAMSVISGLMSRSAKARSYFFQEIKNNEFFDGVDKENVLISLQYGSKSKDIVNLNSQIKRLRANRESTFRKKLSLYEEALKRLGKEADISFDEHHLKAIEREAEQAGFRAMLQGSEYQAYLAEEKRKPTELDKQSRQRQIEKDFWNGKEKSAGKEGEELEEKCRGHKYKEIQKNIIINNLIEHKEKKHATSRIQLQRQIAETKINIALCARFSRFPVLLNKLVLDVVPAAEGETELPGLKKWLTDDHWKELRERNNDLNSFGKTLFGRSVNLESQLRRYHLSLTRAEKKACLTNLLLLIIDYPRYKEITRFISEITVSNEKVATYFKTLFDLINQFFPEEEKILCEEQSEDFNQEGMEQVQVKKSDQISRERIKENFEQINQMIIKQIDTLKDSKLSEDKEYLEVLRKIKDLWNEQIIKYKIVNSSLEDLRHKAILQKEALQDDNPLQTSTMKSSLGLTLPKTMSASCETLPGIQNINMSQATATPVSSPNARKLKKQPSSKAIISPKDKNPLIPDLDRWQEKTGFSPDAKRTKDMQLFDQLIVKYHAEDIEDVETELRFRLVVLCEILAVAWQWLINREDHELFDEVKELLLRAIAAFRRQARLLLSTNPETDLYELLELDLIDETTVCNELEEIDYRLFDEEEDLVEDDPKKREPICCGFFSKSKEVTHLPDATTPQVAATT